MSQKGTWWYQVYTAAAFPWLQLIFVGEELFRFSVWLNFLCASLTPWKTRAITEMSNIYKSLYTILLTGRKFFPRSGTHNLSVAWEITSIDVIITKNQEKNLTKIPTAGEYSYIYGSPRVSSVSSVHAVVYS